MPPRSSGRGSASSSVRTIDRHASSDRRGGRGSTASSPLIALRERLEADAATAHRGGGPLLLGEHRRAAWEIAFDQTGGCDSIEVSTMELSLVCPYARTAMRVPVRSQDCRHLQCCDVDSWLSLLEKHRSMRDPSAPCPVCDRRVSASRLQVDQWQLHTIAQMPPGTHLLVLDADGSYRSGDISRDARRRGAIEVVDVSQAVGETSSGNDVRHSSCSPLSPAYSSPVKSQRNGKASMPSLSPLHNNSHAVGGVKRERVSEEPMPSLDPDSGFSLRATPDDEAIIATFVDTRPSSGLSQRVLPSLARLWIPHCPLCSRALLKNEYGEVERCAGCGVDRDGFTLVRSFPGTSVSLELTADGTLLLCGTDAMAPLLLRAGLCRAMFAEEKNSHHSTGETEGASSSSGGGGATGLWYTSASLTRYEMDFLEACCLRLAKGESVADIPVVPAIFRIR